jgi:hypothetical protein
MSAYNKTTTAITLSPGRVHTQDLGDWQAKADDHLLCMLLCVTEMMSSFMALFNQNDSCHFKQCDARIFLISHPTIYSSDMAGVRTSDVREQGSDSY